MSLENSNRKVLYITYYYPPMGLSGVQRTFKFSKYLPYYNWLPIILTTQANNYYAFDEGLLGELPEEVLIYRTSSKEKKRKINPFPNLFFQNLGRYLLSFIYQPDTKIKWFDKAFALAEDIIKEHNIDVILATAPPFTDFKIAYELFKKYDIPYVIDYRDIWVDNPYHFFPTPYHKNFNIKLEHEILATASRIIVTSRSSKEKLLVRYKFLNHSDITIIPHGYDKEDFDNINEIKKDNQKLIVTHSGLFQDDRTPIYFLKALSILKKLNPEIVNNIEVRFLGLMRKSHSKLIKKFNLQDNCVEYGYVTHKDNVRLLLESDVLWLMMKDNVRSPGKLYEYLGAKKTIFINSPSGNMRQIAMDSNAAFATEADDVEDIKNKLIEIYMLWKENKLPIPDDDFINQFERKKLTGMLAKELALSCKL